MSILDIMIKGGWPMIPIALSSIVVIALTIGRLIALRRETEFLNQFVDEWGSAAMDLDGYLLDCENGPTSMEGLSEIVNNRPGTYDELSNRIESFGRRALHDMEAGLGTLATLAGATPLIGFLGTVTGMIRAFMQIQNLGGNVNANVLAGGIWEALVTTAAGLAVGLLALIAHNYLAGLVSNASFLLEQCNDITLTQLSGQKVTPEANSPQQQPVSPQPESERPIVTPAQRVIKGFKR